MTRRTMTVMAGLGLLAAAGIATIIVLMFGGTDSPDRPGTDAGYAIDPIGTEPADVAVAVISAVFTWQPAIQDSSWDALHSQRDHLVGQMSTAAGQPPNPAPKPLPEWSAWSRSNDIVTAVVQPAGETVIDGGTATVPVTISQTVQHEDGEATPYFTYFSTVLLESHSSTWKVSAYQLEKSPR